MIFGWGMRMTHYIVKNIVMTQQYGRMDYPYARVV